MANSIKLRKSDVRFILEKTFPEYAGRTFHLRYDTIYHLSAYWDGGTYEEFVALRQVGTELQVVSSEDIPKIATPWNNEAHQRLDIPEDVMIVVHGWFCGHETGIDFIVHPNSKFVQKMLGDKAGVAVKAGELSKPEWIK